jgi:hypothetical protein
MSFECRHFSEGFCDLQKGDCHPAIGKCILKGVVVRAKDVKLEDDEDNS